MGNVKSSKRAPSKVDKKDQKEFDTMGASDWDVDTLHRGLNDVAFRFEEILAENSRLKQRHSATFCLLPRRRKRSKKPLHVYGTSELDELRSVFREMTTRVKEIVQENNDMYQQIQKSDSRHGDLIERLNLISEENDKLKENIASLETDSRAHLEVTAELQKVKDGLAEELCDVKSELKFTEESADTIEKEKFECELKVESMEEKMKELEEKLAKFKKLDVEAFSLRRNKRRLEKTLANTEKENNELKCRIEELEGKVCEGIVQNDVVNG